MLLAATALNGLTVAAHGQTLPVSSDPDRSPAQNAPGTGVESMPPVPDSDPDPSGATPLYGDWVAQGIDQPPPLQEPLPEVDEPPPEPIEAPAAENRSIAEIQVRFLDTAGQPTEGLTQPFIITREFDLQPGDVYDQERAAAGLARVLNLDSIRAASLTLEPAADPTQVILVVSVIERDPFFVSLEATSASPSALRGPFQRRSVAPGPDEDTGFAIAGSAGFRNLGGNDQNLILRLRGGEQVLDGELSFTDPWIGGDPDRTGYGVNLFNQRAVQGVFTGGDRDVDLSGGDDPWVHRFGGGVQVFRPLTPTLGAALGLSYEHISVRDDVFSSEAEPEDEDGNSLTVSDDGEDDLLTLRLAADLDQRNDPTDPTAGSRILVGIDQTIPIGDANITFTRFTANYLQYLPVSLFQFDEGSTTLVLNLQAGAMLGDVPPYEAFNLDSGPVRGFGGTEFGTGSSFAQAAAEYRFPIATFSLFDESIDLVGALFAGYATDLGTADEVIGTPAEARDKPGDGFAYGVGLRARTPIGVVRIELGFGDDGSEVILTTGDRF
jgi:outer membrane protein insertion porin family